MPMPSTITPAGQTQHDNLKACNCIARAAVNVRTSVLAQTLKSNDVERYTLDKRRMTASGKHFGPSSSRQQFADLDI
jgi:hypothetical protein